MEARKQELIINEKSLPAQEMGLDAKNQEFFCWIDGNIHPQMDLFHLGISSAD